MPTQKNKREFTRAMIRAQTDLVSGEKTIHGEACDVSMRGMFFLADEHLPEKTECDMELYLAGSNVSICARGRIARIYERGMGIEIMDIDLESFEHLRNMVRMNADNISRVEDEFKDHLGLKARE